MTTTLEIPSSDLNRTLQLNMHEIYAAEGRVDEIAIVNTHKAPELMTCFIKAYNWTVEHVTNITAEAVKAENAANFRKAEIILEEVPRVLREKGITGKSNEDYRNAVIAMDKKYIELRDRAEHIEMYKQLFKGKLQSMENAYMAVRKIFGSSMDFGNRNLGSNHSQSSYHYDTVPPQIPQVTTPPVEIISMGTPYVPSTTSIPIVKSHSPIRAGFGQAKE